MSDQSYFLIHCDQDGSYCLVDKSDIVSIGKLRKNDKVKFNYSKKLYSGVIYDCGGKFFIDCYLLFSIKH